MSKYRYRCGAILIQPNPDHSQEVKLYHSKCRPQHGGVYVLVDKDPEVILDTEGKPKQLICPECGKEIETERVEG